MRKLATHRGNIEDRPDRLPAGSVIPEETLTNVVVLETERLTAVRVASPHLADPRQARDFQTQIIEDATEPRV